MGLWTLCVCGSRGDGNGKKQSIQIWHQSCDLFSCIFHSFFIRFSFCMRPRIYYPAYGRLWLNHWFVCSIRKHILCDSNTESFALLLLVSALALCLSRAPYVDFQLNNTYTHRILWADGCKMMIMCDRFFCCYLVLSLSLLLVFDFITHFIVQLIISASFSSCDWYTLPLVPFHLSNSNALLCSNNKKCL